LAKEAHPVAAQIKRHLFPHLITVVRAFLVRDIGLQAGIVISASHNPARDNGI